jgi:hypothetical protein
MFDSEQIVKVLARIEQAGLNALKDQLITEYAKDKLAYYISQRDKYYADHS